MMKIKIYKYTCYGDEDYTIEFGTKQSVKFWKKQQKEYERQGFSTYDDTIVCIGSVTPDAKGIEKLLGMVGGAT
tara:strand:+ start:2135 stop:2356 length:222 start_codon:yes stop_codon:yes gene_type:complete